MFFFDCLGWMIDESTSRNVEKSPIIYVRYFENWESKTNFYEVLGLDGDDSIVNIVNCIKSLWQKDDINPEKICWFADNAATFTANQALLATLQEIKFGKSLTSDDRETAADLLSSILNDDSLFMLHFHYDLHKCVLEPSWNDYLDSTMNNNSYGAFQIVVDDRDKLRFEPSKLQRYFLVLFEPDDLINNKDEVMKSNYGRQELEYIRTKYRNLSGFNLDKCRNEWKTLKISLNDFVCINEQQKFRRIFWKSFISWKEAIDGSFHGQYKNILILLSIYLISPFNSAERERGY
ncbi:unnamed protein product [Rotaria sp. Silwood2]|nr:unnamed protein product [Rotaria sp. Silwood2]